MHEEAKYRGTFHYLLGMGMGGGCLKWGGGGGEVDW